MSRHFPFNSSNYITIADITAARYEQLVPWSSLFFLKYTTAGRFEVPLAKGGSPTHFAVLKDTLEKPRGYLNGSISLFPGAITNATWYLIVITNDGLNQPASATIEVLDMDGISITSDTGAHGGNGTDPTSPHIIGKNGATGSLPLEGDVAHVAYVDKVVTAQERQDYLANPWQAVVDLESGGNTVYFYLPLRQSGLAEDFSQSGNDGVITGTTASADPPTAFSIAGLRRLRHRTRERIR